MKVISVGPWLPSSNGRRREIRYRARFRELVDGRGRYRTREVSDTMVENESGRRLVNTAPNVSYYADLIRAARKA